jgi:hypothetical protein
VEADIVVIVLHEHEAAIQNLAAIEWVLANLLDDMDRDVDVPVELVPLEISHDMREEFVEVICPVAIRHDDGKALAVTRIVVRGL